MSTINGRTGLRTTRGTTNGLQKDGNLKTGLQARPVLAPSARLGNKNVLNVKNNIQTIQPIDDLKKQQPVLKKNRVAESTARQNVKSESAPQVSQDRSLCSALRPLKIKEEDETITAFSQFILPLGVEDIDAKDGGNILMAQSYVKEIYQYLKHLEGKQKVSGRFLENQSEMTSRMRSILVDWLVSVHQEFKLLPETLYMGVSMMDRFFDRESVSKDKVQLVGVTACFIACKFEEVYPPEIRDFVTICDKLYSKKDILKMEMVILDCLQFELGRPLPLMFLRRFSKAAHVEPKHHVLAKYLMELSLLEAKCSVWDPSLTAAVCLFISLNVNCPESNREGIWTKTIEFYTGYDQETVESHAPFVCATLVSNSKSSKMQNIRKKYAHPKNSEISKQFLAMNPYIVDMATRIPPP